MLPPQSQNASEVIIPEKPKKRLLILSLVIFAFLLIFSITAILTIVYKPLAIGNSSFRTYIGNFVMGLPFMPKTIEYILQSSIAAHEKVTRFTLDASYMESPAELENDKYYRRINGQLDYTNPDEPMISMRSRINDGDDTDIKVKNKIVYYYFNAFNKNYVAPDLIKKEELLNKWFFANYTVNKTFDLIQDYNKTEVLPIEKNILRALGDPEVVKNLTISQSILNDKPVYYLHSAPTAHTLDTFWSKNKGLNNSLTGAKYSTSHKIPHYSDYIDKYILDLWIDRNTYLISKIETHFPFNATDSSGSLQAFVMNISDYGKNFDVEIPKYAVSISDFFVQLMESRSNLNSPEKNNEKRRVDTQAILNAIYQYSTDNAGSLPTGLTPGLATTEISSTALEAINLGDGALFCNQLVTEYIAALPQDPSSNSGANISETDCGNGTWDTGYQIAISATDNTTDSRITVSAPNTQLPLTTNISVTR